MSGSSDQPTRQDLAAVEAADWFAANLVSPTKAPVEGLEAWASAHPLNHASYAAAEGIWADLDAVLDPGRASPPVETARSQGLLASMGGGRMVAWASFGVACLALLFAIFLMRPGGESFSTEVGAQQIAVLDDGTRVSLNTATSLEVAYSEEARAVHFDHGEAVFDVAPDASRPFTVRIGNYRVTALGTSFVVRSDAKGAWVTLIEGRVRVTGTVGGATILKPGERLMLARDATRIDHPELRKLTAWRRGELLLDRTPLTEAVYEINRYTDTPVRVLDPQADTKFVTGQFRTHKSEDFAKSIAALYGLRMVYRDGAIWLESPR